MIFVVTVKLGRNPTHDPTNKIEGPCPVDPNVSCSDMTGQHHTVIAGSIERVLEIGRSFHITRVEGPWM